MSDSPPLDPERIVEVLDRHGVRYVLVGGMGARAHGATRRTYDLDLCPAWHPDNLECLAAALCELDARLRGIPDDVVFPPITGATLRGIEFGTWTTAAGDLDTLHDIPSTDRQHPNTYDELVQRATTREFLGCTIYVADLADIIASKEAAGRDKDRAALPELRALQAARLAGAAYPEGIEAALGERNDPSPPVERPGSDRDYGRDPPGRTLT
ncbi:MAG: hypothetical protein ACRD0C_06185 [Acidimicrobiia bacterium]